MTAPRYDVERLCAALLTTGGDAELGAAGADLELIWRAASGELPPAEVHALAARAVDDPELALVWRLARDLAAADEHARAAEVVPIRRRRWLVRGALAAAAVVMVGVAVALLAPTATPDGERFRDAATPAIDSLLPQGEVRDRSGLVLRWTPGPDGSLYDVVVSDAALDVVARASRLESPQYAVPAAALEALPAGARLLWRVEILTPDGDHLVSPTFVEQLR